MTEALDSPPAAGSGTLFVVATPIGNLEDLSARARRVLGEVAVVFAEDTRHTGKLLTHFGIHAELHALHEHNEARAAPLVVAQLLAGKDVAVVSDAGTPLISDPGYVLVDAVRRAGCVVVPVPGASAITAALSVAGLPTHRFVFEGFLPSRRGPRSQRLTELARETRTMVFYEAPHRVLECLEDMAACFGEQRRAAIAKELTKLHEAVVRGPLPELRLWLEADPARVRGEFVLVVEGATPESAESAQWDEWLRALLHELPPSRASRLVAQVTGANRKQVYQRALELGADTD